MMCQKTFIVTFRMLGTMEEMGFLKKKVKSLSQEKGVWQVDIREKGE